MKVISLTQPYASLMSVSEKRLETRSWPCSHRGDLAIAASKAFPVECRNLCYKEPFATALHRHGVKIWTDLPLGQILCVVNMLGCFPTETPNVAYPEGEFEQDFGDYSDGRFWFPTDNVRVLKEPIPARGRLGLWDHEVRL